MEIHLIWAQDLNGGIGLKGQLPWHVSEDLKNFKKITLNSTIIMGRKTWDSLPIKPLPKRRNVILSSNFIPDVECYRSIDSCLQILKKDHIGEVYVIGGSSVYNYFINDAKELHITFVNEDVDGIDTFFPKSLEEIKKEFTIKEEIVLSKNATYTHWIHSK